MTGRESDSEHKQWLAGVFDRAAPSYDRVGDSYHEHFGASLVEAAEIGPGCRVLDVACGRGAVLLPAARRVGASGSVVGIDLSEAMVHEAQDALHASALEAQVEVRVMDSERLEFGADAFDVVLCAFGVFFFPRPERAVQEFVRVVRPGGLVGLSSWADEDRRWKWEDELLGGLDVPRRAVAQAFDQPDDLERLLRDAGFEEVHSQAEHHEIVFATEDEWWEWKWSYSIRGVLEQIDDAAREAYRRAVFDAMQSLRQPGGFPMRLTACFAFGRKPS